MGGKMSRTKGQRGEREFSKFLISYGYDAHRGRQYAGGPGTPDVITELDDKFHFEVKRTERLSIWPALRQAIEDSDDTQIPIVVHRTNKSTPPKGEWVAILTMDNLIKLIKEIK